MIVNLFDNFYQGIPYGFMISFGLYFISYSVRVVLRVFDTNLEI